MIWVMYFLLHLISLLILDAFTDINHVIGLSLMKSLFSLPFFLIWLVLFLLFRFLFLARHIGLYRFRYRLIPETTAVVLARLVMAFFVFHDEMGFIIGIDYAGYHPDSWSELWNQIKENNFGVIILTVCSILFLFLYSKNVAPGQE